MTALFERSYAATLPPGQSFARASAATYVTAAGQIQVASADEPRFEPGKGLLLEPAATQYVADPADASAASWTLTSGATRSTVSPSLWGAFTQAQIASGGSADSAVQQSGISLTASQAYAFSILYAAGSSGRVCVAFRGTSSSVLRGQVGSVPTASQLDGGSFSALSVDALADGAFLLSGLFTPNQSSSFALEVGPDSTQAGQSVVVLGANITSLAQPSSFILGASRAADALGDALWGISDDVALPQAFPWDEARYPLGLSGKVDAPTITLTPRDVVDPAIFTGPALYANSAMANNDGDGLTAATAKRDIAACVVLGNATGQAYRVYIEAGDYSRRESINGDIAAQPTQPAGFIAQNGRARIFASTPGTYSLHAGNTYSGGHGNGERVFDRLQLTSDGLYTELSEAADLATCEATPGTWIGTGGTVYIHRSDGAQPTWDNTFVSRYAKIAECASWAQDAYFEGLDFEGGPTGCIKLTANADRSIAADNCTFRYAGYSGASVNGTEIGGVGEGIVYFRDCDASASYKDGFGLHAQTGKGAHMLTYRCSGHENGGEGVTSVNAHTVHQDVIALDIAGTYSGSSPIGSVVNNVQTSQLTMLGSSVTNRVDPVQAWAAVHAASTAKAWLAGCTVTALDLAFRTESSGNIEYQHCTVTGGLNNAVSPWGETHITQGSFVVGLDMPVPENGVILQLQNGDESCRIEARVINTLTAQFRDASNGDVQSLLADTPNAEFADGRVVLALRFADDDFAASWNGNTVVTDTSGTVQTVEKVTFKSPLAPMHIDYLAVHDVLLSDAQLQAQSARSNTTGQFAGLLPNDPGAQFAADVSSPPLEDFFAFGFQGFDVAVSASPFLAHPNTPPRKVEPHARKAPAKPVAQ